MMQFEGSDGKTYRAWSHMECREHCDGPHVHNSPFFMYGPYFCPGPAYVPKHRKEV